MRAGITIIGLLTLVVGCSSKPPSVSQQRQDADLQYVDGRNSSLAFDPPITQYGPRLNLSRTPREDSAFVGFDQTITTFFYVRYDDRQVIQRGDNRFERRAVSETFGTSYR